MQVSVETTAGLERRMTVGVPANEIDNAVSQKLKDTARRVKIDGFRPGKVPMSVYIYIYIYIYNSMYS